ncbi:hypothetical protein CGCSCA1_v010543 [Colletotrichum siamense]|nr:hypothetical protein CGCSCA1_v010543 [Colletotrichum siamense]
MEPLGTISAIISIIGAVSGTYNTIDEIQGRPKAFDEIKESLPLVKQVLTEAEHANPQDLEGNEETKKTVSNAIRECHREATVLKTVFEEFQKKCDEDRDQNNTWGKARAWYHVATQGKEARRVETLMEGILQRLQALAMVEVFGIKGHMSDITNALKNLQDAGETLDESEIRAGANHARQTNQSSTTATQNNVSGGRQNNGNHSGNTYNSTVNIASCQTARIGVQMAAFNSQSKPFHYMPQEKNANFVGRAKTLQKLQAWIENSKERPKNVALYGLSGVGKTEIAASFAHWVKETKPEYSVFWTSASSKVNFHNAYESVADSAGLPAGGETDRKLDLRWQLISGNMSPWLLVVDNADGSDITESMLKDDDDTYSAKHIFKDASGKSYLPSHDNGVTLFTTQSRDIARWLSSDNEVEVPAMEEGDSRLLFEKLLDKRLPREADRTVGILLEKLTCLPLAIAHAAAYIKRNQKKVPEGNEKLFNEYLNLLNYSDEQLIERLKPMLAIRGKMRSVVATLTISLKRLNANAAKLLQFLSLVEPTGIPRTMLPTFAGRTCQDEAIGTLVGYAFIHSRNDEGEVFDMHSLVHLVARAWNESDERKRLIPDTVRSAVSTVIRTVPGHGEQFYFTQKGREYLPHALRLLKASEEFGFDTDEVLQLGRYVGCFFYKDRRYHDAAHVLRWVLDIQGKRGGNDLQLKGMLAKSYARLGVKERVMAVEMAERQAQEDDLDELVRTLTCGQAVVDTEKFTSKIDLGTVYKSVGRMKDALNVADDIASWLHSLDVAEHPWIRNFVPSLAELYKGVGQHTKAINILHGIIDEHRDVALWDETQLFDTKLTLGSSYTAAGQCEKAILTLRQLQQTTSADKEAEIEQTHRTKMALANAYWLNGQEKEAAKLYDDLSETFESIPGVADQTTHLGVKTVAGIVACSQNNSPRGINLLEEAVHARKSLAQTKETPNEDVPLLVSQLLLALALLDDAARQQEGVKLINHVAVGLTKVLGEDDNLASFAWKTVAELKSQGRD